MIDKTFGWFVVIAVVAWGFVAFGLSQTQVQAQPPAYRGYPLATECLYITYQGYAVIGARLSGGTCQ